MRDNNLFGRFVIQMYFAAQSARIKSVLCNLYFNRRPQVATNAISHKAEIMKWPGLHTAATSDCQ